MPPTRKIFVSHSSNRASDPGKRARSIQLLRDVCTGLGAPGTGWTPLWDQSGAIEPGADWDRRLSEWMAECHAAVILFSNEALDSEWVRKEAAILSWRRELEEDFTLIPVTLDGLTPEDLARWLSGVLHIEKSQCAPGCANAADIVREVRKGLDARHGAFPKTPYEQLTGIVRDILAARERGADVLEQAWNGLADHEKPPLASPRSKRFASALARYVLRDGRHALEHLRETLNKIRPKMSREQAEELLKYVASLWVTPEAAAGLPASRHDSGVVLLNATYPKEFTAYRYAERAWPLDDDWKPVFVNSQSRDKDAILADVRSAMNASGNLPERLVDKRIARRKEPLVVVLLPAETPQEPDAHLVADMESLRAEFPCLLFMICTGEHMPERAKLPPRARPLEPCLDPDVEENRWIEYVNAVEFIQNAYRGPQ